MIIADPTKLELHDAILKNVHVDFVSRSMRVDVDFFFLNGERCKGSILFFGLIGFSASFDVCHIADNSISGNVNYWVPAEGEGTTFIYFSHGYLSIAASGIEFNVFGPGKEGSA